MGIFDFFKKKENSEKGDAANIKNFTKEAADNLVMNALNVLCDDVSTYEDAKKLILSKGYDEKQAEIIVSSANQLYLKHFKDKTTNKSENTEDLKSDNSKKTLNELYAEKNNSKKALNDLFAEKDKNQKSVETISSEIEVLSDNTGAHGVNFGGLLGFNYFNSEGGDNFLMNMVGFASMQAVILQSHVVSIKDAKFGNSDSIKLRVINKNGTLENNSILSAYPYIKTNLILPFQIKKIVEWSHISNMEAEIQGNGRDTFGLSFFATDYAVNKQKYKSESRQDIKISAVVLVLDKSDLTEINGTPVNHDFVAFIPNNDYAKPTYYDFIGVLKSFTKVEITNGNYGYLINVKLINNQDNPEFFTVDMFVNKENMRFEDLSQGMKITGVLWFQGEIA